MRKLCNIKLVIFDLDGTLIDSAEDIALHVVVFVESSRTRMCPPMRLERT